ncbi:MAG: hypothetical protein IJH04_02055 [Eggerthellaceae bacterium]|nr:hypothetical protein [Eggerthellaceae bacterium]
MIETAKDIKLNVLPLALFCEHLYYYEGPCRFGSGDALKPGYDKVVFAERLKKFVEDIKNHVPEGINVMEPVLMHRNDNWADPEEQWRAMEPAVAQADIVIPMAGAGVQDLPLKFAMRFKKPLCYCPASGQFNVPDVPAGLLARNAFHDYECYSEIRWEDFILRMTALRAKKVLANTNFLCVVRFDGTSGISRPDSFVSLDYINQRFGTRFHYANLHEFIDSMSKRPEGGNHTTPGREFLNVTDEDIEKANKLCDELIDGAEFANISHEKMLPSVLAFITMRKFMDYYDCNAFSMPCPDACSTRRLNQNQFTMCLSHALNLEDGIPSACEYDLPAALSQQALIAVSGMSPYMGNSCPVPVLDGHFKQVFGSTPELLAELEKDPVNLTSLWMTQHSVAHRHLPSPDTIAPYGVSNFAYDQGFGATLRYDFSRDAGQVITLCRISPDGSKMFIGKGEIVTSSGHDKSNCTQAVFYRFKDSMKAHRLQCKVGLHLSLIYGDYTEELKALAEVLGIEALVVE